MHPLSGAGGFSGDPSTINLTAQKPNNTRIPNADVIYNCNAAESQARKMPCFDSSVGYLSGSLRSFLCGGFNTGGVTEDDDSKGGDDDDGEQGIGWAIQKHDHSYPNDRHDASKKIDQAIGDKFFDIGDITCHALHEIAFLLFSMPIKRQTLYLSKEMIA